MLKYKVFKSINFVDEYFSDEKEEITASLDLESKYMKFKFKPIAFVFFDNDNTPIGFISINIPRESSKPVFIDIFISNDYRGRGIGVLMYNTVEKHIKHILKKLNKRCIYATINKKNVPSIKLFVNKLGFEKLPEHLQQTLRRKNVLEVDKLRFYKCY